MGSSSALCRSPRNPVRRSSHWNSRPCPEVAFWSFSNIRLREDFFGAHKLAEILVTDFESPIFDFGFEFIEAAWRGPRNPSSAGGKNSAVTRADELVA